MVRFLLEKLYISTKKRKKTRSFSDLSVLRKTNESPFLGGKGQWNKTASIANLQTYLSSNIMPNDMNVTGNVLRPFIAKKSYLKQSFGNHSASPNVIEEEQDEMSQQNDLLC